MPPHDQFLKAGLRANDVLHSKRNQAEEVGAGAEARGTILASALKEAQTPP